MAKHAIFQMWDGEIGNGTMAGVRAMRAYADRIGADYYFEHNSRTYQNLGRYSPHFGGFKPVYDTRFDKYDHVMVADTDIFPVDGLDENIFDEMSDGIHLGIVSEYFQPIARGWMNGDLRAAYDNRWATMLKNKYGWEHLRRDDGGLLTFNSGVVVWSRAGRFRAREAFMPFKSYINDCLDFGCPHFFASDQPYLQAYLSSDIFNWVELDRGWNGSLLPVRQPDGSDIDMDFRMENSKFVHIQLKGADHWSPSKLWRYTNLSPENWGS